MPFVRAAVRRLRGDDLARLRADVATITTEITELRGVVGHLGELLATLNHDVRSGSEEGLPLFLGYAERFRTDADTIVGAVVVIDRQLQRLTEQVDRITTRPAPDG